MTEKNTDNCCKPFDPAPWEDKEMTWKDKKFVKDHVKCLMRIPIDMKEKMEHNMELIKAADAKPEEFLMLTDGSAFGMDIFIEVTKDVPDTETITISGTFLTKVFDGSLTNVGKWSNAMQEYAAEKGKEAKKIYTFFTTCPKCAKEYGHNYVVLLAQV